MNAAESAPKIDSAPNWAQQVQRFAGFSDRRLFHRLLHGEYDPDILKTAYATLCRQLDRLEAPEKPFQLNPPPDQATPHGNPFPHDQPGRISGDLIRQYSPCGLLELCWLEDVAQAATAHTEVSAHLFNVYRHAFPRQARYRRLLQSIEPDLPDIRSRLFSELTTIPDEAFRGAVVRLCLARFPRLFLPELIGFTLAHEAGISPLLRALKDASMTAELFEAEPQPAQHEHLKDRVDRAAVQFIEQADDPADRKKLEQRMGRGFALYESLETSVYRRLMDARGVTVAEKIAALMAQKAPYAFGHHKNACLGGKTLDHWFSETPFQAQPFLTALSQSPYVNLDTPEESRLFELMGPRGPMFGVFSEREREILLNWLEEGAPAPMIQAAHASPITPSVPPSPSGGVTEIDAQETTPNARELFHRLVNSDLHPGFVPAARRLVEHSLQRARRKLFRKHRNSLAFFPYDAVTFERRVYDLYKTELARYQPLSGAAKISRAAYRWAIEQMAPTILVDGCWLQNIGHAQAANGVVCRLFRIYADEIGDGRADLNHANVYRELLSELGIELPEVTGRAFSVHPGFIDGAFDLPNYLLAISCFPESFLPELIGLNLAIELSGLGAAYLRLVDELEYWSINPRIIRLHISIDNMASGHAALARETVILHLENVLAEGGHSDVQAHWKRILGGYYSLRTVPRSFAWRLALTYFVRFKAAAIFKQISLARIFS
ncbi:MAG: iron-containing redox enzyme family protein [Pseudomonadota bacterium]